MGIADVGRLQDSLTPEEMDRWHAFSIVEGWGDAWRQCGTIAAVVYNTINAVAAGMSGVKFEEHQMRSPEDFIPKPADEHKPRSPRVLSGAEAKRAAQMRYGV